MVPVVPEDQEVPEDSAALEALVDQVDLVDQVAAVVVLEPMEDFQDLVVIQLDLVVAVERVLQPALAVLDLQQLLLQEIQAAAKADHPLLYPFREALMVLLDLCMLVVQAVIPLLGMEVH